VERVFSVSRWFCADFQLIRRQETISPCLMIQSNWNLGEPLPEVLVMTLWTPSRISEGHARLNGETDWRLQVHTEGDLADSSKKSLSTKSNGQE
jgi:hypothetical protein